MDSGHPLPPASPTTQRPAKHGPIPRLGHLGGETVSLHQATVMMVDDEMTTMEVMQAYLEEAGYTQFILLDQSTQAISQITSCLPDIVLLDLMMPEVSGFDILQQLRGDSQLSHLPVIMLTSSTDAETKLKALDYGATDFLAKPVDPSELVLRVRNTLAARAYQNQLAYYDALTKLPNRSLFIDRLTWFLQRAERQSENLVVMHIMFKQFKRLHSAFGPQVSDRLITQIAERMRSCIRRSDVFGRGIYDGHEVDSLFRMDGDEFSLLCPTMAQPEHATNLASRILRVMEPPFNANGTEVFIRPSIGIASYPTDALDTTALLQCAVAASTQAGAEEKGGFLYYSKDLNQENCSRLQLEADLRHAINNGELLLHYQPKVSVKTGRIAGVETLVRWRRPDGTYVFPDQFIPLAEDTGLIIPLGEWVLREACAQMTRWQNQGVQIQVAVNVSAKQFHGGHLTEVVRDIISASGVDARYLTLELTESLLMANAEQAVETLNHLMSLGPKISMDDFGTGYSSLSYLKRFPLHELKIDRSFLSDVTSNPEGRALVSAMIYLAHEFGLQVVAEGVEAQEQLDILTALDCDQYQGYFFSRPVPVEELNSMLVEQPMVLSV